MDEILIKLSVDGTTGNVTLEATDKNLQKLVQTVKNVDQATKTMSDSFVSSFQNMRNLGQGFTQAFGMIENVFGAGIKKAMEYELSLAKLSGVIRSGGKDSEVSAAGMEKQAAALSKNSMFYKSDILDVQRYFLSFKNIGAGSIDEATQAAMGLSQVLGSDLRGATIALAKALDQGSEGMKALNRMGLKLSSDELEHVKNLEDEGKTYEMQSYILTLLASKYKDVNTEIQKTDAFKLNQAEKALGDLQKQGGILQLMTVGPLLVGLSNMIKAFDTLNPSVKGFTATALELTIAFGILNSTGIGQSILGVMRLGGSLNSLRASAALSKIQLGELTAVEYEESVAAIDAAAANKGFFASMGLVGWAVIAVTAFATVWGMVSEKIDKAKQSMGEEENNLRTQQHEYKTLSDIIKDSTKSVEERNDAIKEITAKYPEYNKQSNLENLTEKEKNEILDKGNDLFETRIRLQGKKDALTDISKKLAAAEFDRDKKKQKLDQTTIKNEEDGKDPNDKVKKEWFGATSGEGVDYNNAQKIVDDIQADYDLAYKGTKSSDEEEKPEKRAAKLLEDTTKTAELTNDAIDKYVKELKEIEGKLKNNSELSKKVNERMDSLGKLRSGKTGSPGLGSTLEDTKITLQNLTEISDLYGAIDEKWSKIDDLQVKDKKGVEDPSKTKNERIKGKYKIREELEKNIDNLLKDKTKASETETESKGGDKLEVLQAKLKTMQSIINQVNEESKKWDAKDRDKFPVISKQKRDEWANDIKKTQNEINKASFDDSTKTMQQEEEYITKRMELENSGDMEKLLLKQEYLEKELELAKKFHQTEKAEEIQHKLNLLDVDKEEAAKRILQNSRDVNYDLKISKAGRTKIAPNVSDEYNASTLEEEKKYNDDLEKIKENTLLTDAQKKSISEELEKAHQERIHDIKRKYYDSWLGELTGLSRLEIEGVSQVFQQLETTANTLMNMQSKKGQEDADNYRKTENDKLDIQKKAALASARTDQQKQKIEDDYTKKKDKIDDEANAKGQERIKTMFAIQKAASIANAIISTYEGADKALGAYPPPIGAILMAATIAAGLANVAAISAQEPPKFAIGGLPGAILGFMTRPQGFIQGPGSGTSDSILARISNKEFIVNAAATERNRMLLEQINKGSFSSGGYAGNGSYLSSLTNISNVDTGTVNEIKALSDRVDKLSNNLIDMMDRISSQPVAIGDEACRRITSKGIGRMKRSKSIL